MGRNRGRATASLVHRGHARWDIENHGFNELVNGWHADHVYHVYKDEANAIEAFLLTAFLAYNLFPSLVNTKSETSDPRRQDPRLLGTEVYQAAAILIHGP